MKMVTSNRKDGLSMATALPVWDPRWRQASMKMGGEPPAWIQIFPYPEYVCTLEGERSTLITDDVSQRFQVETFEERGVAAPFDYEHATTEPGVFYAPAAGRITRIVAGGKLGLLGQCEWNDVGSEDLRSGRYYYDSPTFWYSPEDMRIYRFVSMALTNLPGSFNRGYITENNKIDYAALIQNAAKGRAFAGRTQPLKLVCAKGGTMAKTATPAANTDTATTTKTLSDSVLNSMKYAFDLPLTTTSNDLRSLLQTMIDLIPANDDPIFMIDDDQKSKGVKTVGQILGLVSGSQKDPVDEAALRPLRTVLAIADQNADVNAIALEILKLKASTVPIAKYHELEGQLAAGQQKTAGDRLTLKILAARNNGQGVTPENEREAQRLAAQSIELAESYIDAIPPLDLSSQSRGTAPTKVPDLPPATNGKGDGTMLSESQKAHKRTLAIAKEHKVDYAAASAMRLEEEAAAAETE